MRMGSVAEIEEPHQNRQRRTVLHDFFSDLRYAGTRIPAQSRIRRARRRHHGARHRRQHGGLQRRERRAPEAAAVSRAPIGSSRSARRFSRPASDPAAGLHRQLSRLARPELVVRGHGHLPRRGIAGQPGRPRPSTAARPPSMRSSFACFGVEPILGRTFTPEETAPEDRPRRHHQPRVLAKPVRRGSSHPRADHSRGHHAAGDRRRDAAGLPVSRARRMSGRPQTTSSTSRTGHNFLAVARLKPDVSLEQAQAELNTIAAAPRAAVPGEQQGPRRHRGPRCRTSWWAMCASRCTSCGASSAWCC